MTPMAPTRVTPPIGQQAVAAAVEMKPACLRLSRQGGACRRRASRRISRIMHYYTINSSVKKSGDDDADPLKYFSALHASCSFCNIFISVMSFM
jgi:hypothetical protein